MLVPLFVAIVSATAALAQVNYEPTPPPDTAANDRSWYRSGDPIPFAGDVYYQTGPNVYFNGNTMVPTGEYDGVTLYADTTLPAYTVVFVPVGGNLLRPYSRFRTGDLTATTGHGRDMEMQDQHPTRRPRGRVNRPPEAEPPGEPPQANEPFEGRRGGLLVETVRKPNATAGMWLTFQGFRWEQAGEGVTLDPMRLTRIGDYYGRPVYADPRAPYVVYVPFRANVVAPFRRTGA